MRLDKAWAWALAMVGLATHTAADPTWPSPAIDELEEIMFQTDSVGSRKFADSVSPCSNQANGPGRFAAAEWVRTAFHDMATHNRVQQSGGLDASIQYELTNGDNAGPAFSTTLAFMAPYFSRRSSLSDLIALGIYTAVRTCRGPAVPFRPGRIDATAAGSVGVPQPQNAIGIFRNQFTRMGFTNQEMIQVTACGHTLGSVHSSQFPDLVPPGTTPNNQMSMDSTVAVFDNRIVTEYLGWNTTNPLIVGRSVASNRNSDWKVFSSDANATMNAMSDPAAFQAACRAVLQKMIDVVPGSVTLGDPIAPYQVKPVSIQLTLGASASVLELTGSIRIRTTELPRTTIQGLTVTYKNRNGGSVCGGPCSFTLSAQGLGRGIDDEFVWFPIAVNIPVSTGISSFVVTVRRTDGTSATYDNNGDEYPVQDAVFLQRYQSCLLQTSGISTFTAAVRNDRASLPAQVMISYKMNQDNSPVPRLTSVTLDMTKGACVGGYTFFSVSTTIPGGHSAEADFDFISGTGSSAIVEVFRKTRVLGGTCRAFASPGTCSTPGVSSLPPSSTVSRTSTVPSQTITSTTVSSASPVPSLHHREAIGGYRLVSCWTEGSGARALGGATFVSADMTLERCMANCAGFDYWGTEYGVECYCGNSLHSSSSTAPLSECNMVCGGDNTQYCGAGNRIELYSTTATRSSTSTSSAAAPTATLARRPTVGKYSLVGCQTEGTGVRALAGAATASDDMTLDMCASFCTDFAYFGAEYGRECEYLTFHLSPLLMDTRNRTDESFLQATAATRYNRPAPRHPSGNATWSAPATPSSTAAPETVWSSTAWRPPRRPWRHP